MLIGETSSFEKTTDRTYYSGDGSKTQFGIQFSGDNVQVFLDGLLQRNATDISIDAGGMSVTFVTAPVSGAKIDCLGFLEVTNLGRNSVRRVDQIASAGQIQFTVPDLESTDSVFVTLNGIVLHVTDFTKDISNDRIILGSPATQDDSVTIMHFKAGFRAGQSSVAAAASALDAETSATNAAAIYDSFDDRYLGAKSGSPEPALDNDGDALIDGALYFNTTTNNLRVCTVDAGPPVVITWAILDTLPQALGTVDTPEFTGVTVGSVPLATTGKAIAMAIVFG